MSESEGFAPNWRAVVRILAKTLGLFIVLNALFVLANPLPSIGRLSVYNAVVPGRQRLPFGERPDVAYNLSLFQLDAMFTSHEVAAPKADEEFRVLLVGDSSVWGILLTPEQTLAGYLNQDGLTAPDGRPVQVYNLGYPTISLTKDLMLLSEAMRYEPDMVIWLVTLEAFPASKQLDSPLVQNNPDLVRDLIARYDLNLDPNDPNLVNHAFWERTIVGQRRGLADVLRLNLYGVMWAATGVDQFYPENYAPRMEDLPADESFHGLQPPHLSEADLAFDVLAAGAELVGDTPLLIVNEPMFVSSGENSDIRYNFFYPRWAYDDYRVLLAEQAEEHGWRYVDLWDAIPNTEYTNSAIHLTPEGSAQLAALIDDIITEP